MSCYSVNDGGNHRALKCDGHCHVKILSYLARHMGCEYHFVHHYYTSKAVHKPTSKLVGTGNLVYYFCASDAGPTAQHVSGSVYITDARFA